VDAWINSALSMAIVSKLFYLFVKLYILINSEIQVSSHAYLYIDTCAETHGWLCVFSSLCINQP
jgi:hypothetical protein